MLIQDMSQLEERHDSALTRQRTPEPNGPMPAQAAYPSLKPVAIGLLPGDAMAQMTEMAVAVAKRLRLEQLDALEASSLPIFHSSGTPSQPSTSEKHKQRSISSKSRPGSSYLPLPHTVPSQTSTPKKQLGSTASAPDRTVSRSPRPSRPGSAVRALEPEISGPIRDPRVSRSSSRSRPGSAARALEPETSGPIRDPRVSRSSSRSRPGSAARALEPEISGPIRDPRVSRSSSRSRPGSAARALEPEISGSIRDPRVSRSSSRSRPGSAARALEPEISGPIRDPRVSRSISVADRGAVNASQSRCDSGPDLGTQESLELPIAPRRSSSRSQLAARPSSSRLPSESGRSRGSGVGRSVAPSPSKLSQAIVKGGSSRNGRDSMELTDYPPWPPGREGGPEEGGRSLSRSGSRSRHDPAEKVDSPLRGLESPKSTRRGRGASASNGDRLSFSADKPSRSLRVGQQGPDSLSGLLPLVTSIREAPWQRPPRPPSSQSDRQQQRQAPLPQQLHEQPANLPRMEGEYILGSTQQRLKTLQQVDQHQPDKVNDNLRHEHPEQQQPQQQERETRPTSRDSNSNKGDRTQQRPARGSPGASCTSGGRCSPAAGGQIERSASFSSHSDAQTSVRSDVEAAIRAELAAAVAAAVAAVASPFNGVSDQALDTRAQGAIGLAACNPPRRPAPPIIPAGVVGKVEVASEQRTTPDSALNHAVVAKSAALVRDTEAPEPPPIPVSLMPHTDLWSALESHISEPMLESMAPQPRSELQLLSRSEQPSAPQPSSTPQVLSLPEGSTLPLPHPPVANTGRPTTALTPATLAARLQLPRSFRSPATTLRDAASGSLPAAASANAAAAGLLGGSPLTNRLSSRPPDMSKDCDSIPVSSASPLEADARVEVRPSGSGSVPYPDGNRCDRGGPVAGKAGGCGDGRGPPMGPYVSGIGAGGADPGKGLGCSWQQYPGEAGSHPDMVMAAGGTLPLLYGDEWEDLTHEVVWRVARSFGFQVFNLNPETTLDQLPQWTPATAFLVSEHLCRILVQNMLPRMKPPVTAMPPIASRQTGAGASFSVAGASSSIYSNPRPTSTAVSGIATTVASPGGVAAGGPVKDSLTSARHSSVSKLPLGPAAEAAEAAAAAGGPRFAMALYELHNTIFYVYEQRWCPHLDLRPRPRELQRVLEMTRWADSAALNGLLSELALYFLLYSEAANLRHTPELMWFLFWSAVHSPNMERMWREGLPDVRGEHRGAWGRRIRLRTQFQREIAKLQAEVGAPLGSRPQPSPVPPQQLPADVPPDLAAAALPAFAAAVTEMLLASAAAAIATASPMGTRLTVALSPSDTDLLADLAAYGDGGFVMDRVVTPLFYFLSHEMDALFEAGVEVAHRLGYDDVNESMCRRDVVDPLLHALGVSEDALVFGEVLDVWRALTELGCTCPAETSIPGHLGPSPITFDAQLAANFWSAEVFVKTFRERRSWAAVFRAFFRVYCLQLVLLTLIMAAAFAPRDPGALSSAVISHAWLAAAERITNWWLTRNPPDPLLIRQRKKAQAEAQASAEGVAAANSGGEDGGGGTRNGVRRVSTTGSRSGSASHRLLSGRGTLVDAEASGLAGETSSAAASTTAAMADLMAPPEVESPEAARARRRLVPMEGQPLFGGLVGCLDWVLCAVILTALYALYWEDPGGTGILHRLHLGLRIWWVPFSMAYGSGIVLLGVLTTRAGYRVSILSWAPALRCTLACHSAMPPAGCWLEGCLGVDWKAWVANTAMWGVILAVKVAFEYYIIAKPLVAPMRALFKHNFPGCSSWPCSHVSWVLAALRALPLCMVCLADTSIIYNAVMALFGILRGLLRLDLGTVASWEELRAAFHRGPVRWWRRCMSAEGVSSHRRALRRHLMEGGQDRAAVEAFVPETPAAQNNISSDEDSDDGADNGNGGTADGVMSNEDVEDHTGDEDRLSSAAMMPSSMGSKALGLMWPLRTMGREARWARERRALGRIRENGGASAMAMMELQDADESQNLMLQAAERWATAPALPPLIGSSFMSSHRRAGGRGAGINALGIAREGGSSGRWEALEPLQRPRGPIRRPSTPGASMQRNRRRFSEGGGARAVAEGLEKAERSVADVSGRRGGNSSTAGPAADGGRSGRWSRSGGGTAGPAAVVSNSNSDNNARRPPISGSDGEVERRLVGTYSPVIRNLAKAPDVSGLSQRLPRRSTPSDAPGGASCGSGSGSAAPTGGWGIFMRHNTVAPLPLSPPVTEVPAMPPSPDTSQPGTRRVASFGGVAGATFGGVECLITPRRPAFTRPRVPAGPVAEATSTSSTPVGLTRLTRREAASLAVHERTPSPTSMHATRRKPAGDGWRQRDQDYWQQRQQQLLSSGAAPPPVRTPISQAPPVPPERQITPPRVEQPKLLTRASLGSLSDLSSDRDDPEAARQATPAARGHGEAVTFPTAAPSEKVGSEAIYRRPSWRPPGVGSETTERDRVMALQSTEDLSLGVLLSRQNGDLAMWDAFATVWDGIVDDLRAADLISDRESGNLRFMRLGHFQGRHALRPILLPAFFYAGVVQAFVDTGRLASGGGGGDGATTTILTELRSLVVWLSCELRLLSEVQAEVVMGTSFLHTITDVDHANYRAKMLHAGQALVKQLLELCAAAAKQQQLLLQQPRGLQRQQRQRPAWHQAQAAGGKVHFEDSTPAGGKFLNVTSGARMGCATSQRQFAKATAKGLVASHVDAIGGSLREVLEALAGEARAMRRAVASGRLASESLAAAIKLEEVAKQVLADLSAHPDFLSSCLTNLLPRAILVCPPRATDAKDDEPESSTATGGTPSANPTAASNIQTPHPIPSNFVDGNLTTTEVPLIHLGSPSSARSTEPRAIASGGASSFPLHHGPPATSIFPDSPTANISGALVSDIAAAGAGAVTSLPRAPSLARVQASEDFVASGMRKGGRSGSSWGSGSLESVAPPPLEPEVALRVRVVEVLVKMLTTPASACRPAGAEALRILGFFINSLSNPQLKKPPPLSDMLSWSVLTPCYEEDVLYPLSADHAARQLGLAPPPPVGPGRPPDLLSETEDNVSLMSYLRSVFPADWKNFMERLSGMLGGADLSRVTENDFAPMGPLHALAAELQLWATYRGQLLGRTVRGMMCYRRAVRMLVELEYPRPAGVSPAAYNAWAEAFVDCKFQYVCTCQVYGKNRKATDIRRRWLAEGVDSLCLEFPALRVAYLDSAVTSYGPTEYSVLLRGNPDHPAALAGAARGVASAEATAAAVSADDGPLSASAPTQPPLSPQQPQAPGPMPRALFSPLPPSNSSDICFKTAKGKGKEGSSKFENSDTSSTVVRSSAVAATVSSSAGNPTLELYRVRLPHNRYGKRGVILGEGKPENQNHAAIFCFGEALQTIDMNQDNALAEALKMRNLLRELAPEPAPRRLQAIASHPRGSTSSEHHRQTIAARTAREVPVALVGFREWIFSDVSGALGTFAAACELAFGTIVQRTMSYPGRVRLHYGHPDVFNKMHIMTRGGLSKATRQLHISEDVFGGFNQLLRGAQIKYKEYISCGKGRDMGFDSINAFEIKISGGGGECVVSRDVARLAARMDLARLLHFYHSGPGYYINSLFIMTAVWLNIWVVAVFALARASTVQRVGSDGTLHLEDTLRVEHALSLGPLMLLPYAAQLLLEWGALRTFATLAVQVISGSVAFAVFRQQTTAYYFKDDITYGGARYISTGRGFSITSSSFTTLFTNYARSHLYPGMELLHLLILYASVRDCKSCSFAAVTWGTWLVAVALLFSPFWFNPMAFTREKVSRDWSAWLGWMRGEVDPATGNNWHSWNRKQLEKVRNERGTVTDPGLNIMNRLVDEVAPRLVLVVAAVSRLDLRIDVRIRALSSPLVPFFAATAIIWLVTLLSWALQRHFEERGRGRAWRLYRVMMSALVAAALLSYSVFAVRFFRGTPMSNLALLLYANSQLVLAVHRALEQLAPASSAARTLVDRGYWLIDWGVGTLLMCFVTLLAWLGFVSRLQTRLLFNSTFAASIRRGKLVRSTGLMKLDEEQRWRNEGQARAALAQSVAMSLRRHTATGMHYGPPLLQPEPGAPQPQRYL